VFYWINPDLLVRMSGVLDVRPGQLAGSR
jgi:hypothetical protein